MTIEELTFFEVEEAAALLQRDCSELPWSTESLLTYVLREDAILLAAKEDEKLVGFAGLLMVPPEADVLDITVDRAHRRQGIGEALFTELLNAGRARGVTAFHLEVRESNDPAQALYRKFGFQEAGRRKNYYTDPVEDALVMQGRL